MNMESGDQQIMPPLQSVSAQISDRLRHMILVGELPPGQQVTQEGLAAKLGVSTMPIREALLKLSHEGFIEVRRSRSFRVSHTTREDVADIYWLHAKLAGELTSRACHGIDDATLKELESFHHRWNKIALQGRPEILEAMNWTFHRRINHAAHAPKLLLILRQTTRMIPEHFYTLVPGWASMSAHGHREILDALHARDSEMARKAAEQHVLDAGKLLIVYFDDMGFWKNPAEGSNNVKI